jgi:hypothetical protein
VARPAQWPIISIAEQLLKHSVQVDAPDLIVVSIAGAFRELVLDVPTGKQLIKVPASGNCPIVGATANPDQFVVLIGFRRIGQGFADSVFSRGAAEDANVREKLRMIQSNG